MEKCRKLPNKGQDKREQSKKLSFLGIFLALIYGMGETYIRDPCKSK